MTHVCDRVVEPPPPPMEWVPVKMPSTTKMSRQSLEVCPVKLTLVKMCRVPRGCNDRNVKFALVELALVMRMVMMREPPFGGNYL